VPLGAVARKSGTPAYKSVVVSVEKTVIQSDPASSGTQV
jgi:hypothetical protein